MLRKMALLLALTPIGLTLLHAEKPPDAVKPNRFIGWVESFDRGRLTVMSGKSLTFDIGDGTPVFCRQKRIAKEDLAKSLVKGAEVYAKVADGRIDKLAIHCGLRNCDCGSIAVYDEGFLKIYRNDRIAKQHGVCWHHIAQFHVVEPEGKKEIMDKAFAEAKKHGKLVLYVGNTGG